MSYFIPVTLKKILASSIFILSVYTLHAQGFKMGFAFQNVLCSGTLLKTHNPGGQQSTYTYQEKYSGYTGMLGFDLAYYKPVYITGNDLISFGFTGGIRPLILVAGDRELKNIAGQQLISASSSVDATFQAPIFVSANYGSFAEEDSEGFGMGLNFGVLMHTFVYGTIVGDKGSQVSPVAMFEIGSDRFSFKGYYILNKYHSFYQSTMGNIPKLTYTTFGISLCLGI